MIKNKHLNKIMDIDPIDDRTMKIVMKGTVPHTFINTYMYTAKDHEKPYKIRRISQNH